MHSGENTPRYKITQPDQRDSMPRKPTLKLPISSKNLFVETRRDSGVSQNSNSKPQNSLRLNAKDIALQLENVMKTYHFSHKPSKYVNRSTDSDVVQSPVTSTMETSEKLKISYEEEKESILSPQNRSEHKTYIERLHHLASRRKVNEASLCKLGKTQLSPIQEKKDRMSLARGSMTINRFIDGMIMKGSIPLEASEYFIGASASPTLRNLEIKSPTSKHQSKNQIKLKPIVSKESKEKAGYVATSMDEIPNDLMSKNIDIIPNWMSSLADFNEKYGAIKMRSKLPVYDILSREPNLRGALELNFICKWLEKMDLFQKFPYDILHELSLRLKTIYLKEGQVLCNVGDNADCLYIVYEGAIDVLIPDHDSERLIVTAKNGEVLGRQTLETEGKRTARLKASETTYVIVLYRNDYQEVSGEIRNMIKPSQVIYDFVTEHEFLSQFTEAQKLSFMNHFEFRKHYKNDIIYNVGDNPHKFYFLIKGEVTRQLPITKEKINKWPTSMNTWKMYKKSLTYSVKIPLTCGEIFGLKEFLEDKPREEKIITEGDALVLSCSKNMFYELFEKYEISIFQKKAEKDEKVKEEKLASVFDISTRISKIKEDAIEHIVKQNGMAKIGKNQSQEAKVKEWKRAYDKLTSAAVTEKRIIEKKETHKDLSSVYEN